MFMTYTFAECMSMFLTLVSVRVFMTLY